MDNISTFFHRWHLFQSSRAIFLLYLVLPRRSSRIIRIDAAYTRIMQRVLSRMAILSSNVRARAHTSDWERLYRWIEIYQCAWIAIFFFSLSISTCLYVHIFPFSSRGAHFCVTYKQCISYWCVYARIDIHTRNNKSNSSRDDIIITRAHNLINDDDDDSAELTNSLLTRCKQFHWQIKKKCKAYLYR